MGPGEEEHRGAEASAEASSSAEANAAAAAAASQKVVPPFLPVEIDSTPVPSELGGGPCGRRFRDGDSRGVIGFIGGIGARVVDNMSFVGEVLVEFLELDKPRYHHEIEKFRKQKRQEAREKQRAEAEAIASIEEADVINAD